MAVSLILLAVTLGLWSLDVLFSLGVNIKTIAVLALATSICLLLEALGVINWTVRRRG